MTGQQRVQEALAHRPGAVPLDFGSTAVTGMHVSVVAQLRDYYGLAFKPVTVCEPYQMLGRVDDDLAAALGVDTVGVVPRNNLFGFANEGWRGFRAPWGQELLVPGEFRTRPAPGGGLHIFPGGDETAPPSGHMPEGGFFFDALIRQEPIDEENLNPEDNLEEFGPISEADLSHFRDEVKRVAGKGRAVVATFGGTAFGDIALVPAPFLKQPHGVRDIARWYMTTALNPGFIHAVFSRQCEIALANLARIHGAVGNAVDVVFVCGTDFGTQSGSFCSPATFEALYAPYYRRVNDWIHAHTTWKTFKHSCGAVEPFMRHFIDCGFDIINPVQCSATGMDPRALKERYGDRLTFWGGGVDTQRTLPFGTPAQVRDEVRQRCDIFAAGGGFVFDAIHNVQARTPVANIVALIDAVKAFNG
jgi:hypothetical protein